jgi:dTDP-4-amino-4,6-dideoxygalactose transaminase
MTMSTAAREHVRVPFLDLTPSHAPLKQAVLEEIADLIDDNAFINGPQVAAFEDAFADYCGALHCVGLASGLDALRLGLIAAGAERGAEVVVPANTFVATLEAVTQAGLRPVVVDASEHDLNIDVEAVEAAIGRDTQFVLPVHLYGQMADMRGLMGLAERRGVMLVEDACQAHGATRDDLRSGSAGAVAAFSFYPGKNLGAFGDAGAAVTGDASVADRLRALREHGQTRKYHHEREGWTARLDTVQAVVLLRKLGELEAWNGQRRAAAAFYDRELAGVGDLELPPVAPGSEPVWHLYVVRTKERDALSASLAERGIATLLHYPQPVHLAPAYAELGYAAGSFPVAEATAERVLSLPIFPGISDEQLAAVADGIKAFFDGR